MPEPLFFPKFDFNKKEVLAFRVKELEHPDWWDLKETKDMWVLELNQSKTDRDLAQKHQTAWGNWGKW